MIAWMVYAAVVGGVVAVGGWACERLSAAAGRPRRIAWFAALAVAVVVPLTGGWRKPGGAVVETGAAEPPAIGGAVVGDLWSAIPALPVPEGMATGRIALLAWGAGSLVSLAVLGGVLLAVARGRRRWERRRVHGADVYVSRRFGPALVGVARPKVVIPAWVLQLEPGARYAIIRHEAEHGRARDHLVLLYGGLVAAAFPWNPAIWWMYRRLRAAVELDCDQRVLASGIEVADYGDVLLDAGSRSNGRWGFAPAMGQPESLLERRLKTMSETRRKLNAGHAVLLMTLAAGTLVVACDTPVPTEVREAFEEVMAEEAAQGADADLENRIERLLQARAFGSGPPPLLYVDGVRIRNEEDLPATVGDPSEFPMTVAENIERVEILKGPAAIVLYGEEAAGGVIQVFTKGAEAEAVLIVVPPDRKLLESGQVKGWEKWFSETVVANAPPGLRPVIYVDGVRVDDGGPGLNELHPSLTPDRIDHIEVIKGEAARELYGKEAANGVILIVTKKEPSKQPAAPLPE